MKRTSELLLEKDFRRDIRWGKIEKVEYEYDTDIFEKYIIKFMAQHLSQWQNQNVFNGGDLVIDFFNDVIECGRVIKPEE